MNYYRITKTNTFNIYCNYTNLLLENNSNEEITILINNQILFEVKENSSIKLNCIELKGYLTIKCQTELNVKLLLW